MDESGTLPSDPPPSSGEPDRETAPGNDAPSPAEETADKSGPPDPAPALTAEERAIPDEAPAAPVPEIAQDAPADEETAPPAQAPEAATSDGAPPAEPAPPDAAALAAAAAAAAAAAQARIAAEHARLASENTQRLEREIESLRAGHLQGAQREFRSFFEQERRLHALFKELSPLLAADRHRLWSALKQIGAEVRRAQQEEWESRRYQSIEAREAIDEKLRAAESLAQGTGGADGTRKADVLLGEVRALLGSSAPDSPGRVLIGPDRRACWDRWRQARDAVRQRRSGLQEQDQQALAALVAEVVERAQNGDPFQAIQRVKELQAQLGRAFLRRGQFEELRKRLSEAWQAAQGRVVEQRRVRARLHGEWHERMEGHLARWQETLEHKRGQREHLIQQAAKLEGMEQNARSEDFAAQVRAWRAESAEKLRRTEEFIAELEERIRSTAKKLGGRSASARAPGSSGAPPAESPAPPENGPPGPPEAES